MAGTQNGANKRLETLREKSRHARAKAAGSYPAEWDELPLVRADAKAQNIPFFFTGIPCSKEHISIRQASKGVCEECHRLYRISDAGHAAQRALHAKRMESDESYRQAKRDDAVRYYHRNKDDEAFMEKLRVKNRAYQATDRGKQKAREAMARFVSSGKKAESDARYAATTRGQQIARASRKRYVEKVERETGLSYTQAVWANNPQAKLHARMNTLISTALKNVGVRKSLRTAELVGCSIAELKQHLEQNFQEGMSWENYSRHGWHIDHIRPCASFNLEDEQQQKTCNNWRNLLPMWAEDNIGKGDRYDLEDELDWSSYMKELGYSGDLFLVFRQ